MAPQRGAPAEPNVLVAQGNRDEALTDYKSALKIAKLLSERDEKNTEWQRDLIVSYVKIESLDPASAEDLLRSALAIALSLESTGRLAPVDAWMPEDLRRRLAALDASSASG
jgi:hypothetical protein